MPKCKDRDVGFLFLQRRAGEIEVHVGVPAAHHTGFPVVGVSQVSDEDRELLELPGQPVDIDDLHSAGVDVLVYLLGIPGDDARVKCDE